MAVSRYRAAWHGCFKAKYPAVRNYHRINRISTLILNPLLSVQKQNTLTKFCAFLTGGLATNNAKCRKHCDFQVHISSENSSTTKPKYFSKSLGNFEQISNPFILLVSFSVGILRKFRTTGYLVLKHPYPGCRVSRHYRKYLTFHGPP